MPAYAPPGHPPAIVTWSEENANVAPWRASPCLRWTAGRPRMVAALSGTLQAGSLDELLVRAGLGEADVGGNLVVGGVDGGEGGLHGVDADFKGDRAHERGWGRVRMRSRRLRVILCTRGSGPWGVV